MRAGYRKAFLIAALGVLLILPAPAQQTSAHSFVQWVAKTLDAEDRRDHNAAHEAYQRAAEQHYGQHSDTGALTPALRAAAHVTSHERLGTR